MTPNIPFPVIEKARDSLAPGGRRALLTRRYIWNFFPIAPHLSFAGDREVEISRSPIGSKRPPRMWHATFPMTGRPMIFRGPHWTAA